MPPLTDFNKQCVHGEAEIQTQGKAIGDTGRDWRGTAANQGMPRNTGNHPKLEEARKDSSQESPRRDGPMDTMTVDF